MFSTLGNYEKTQLRAICMAEEEIRTSKLGGNIIFLLIITLTLLHVHVLFIEYSSLHPSYVP